MSRVFTENQVRAGTFARVWIDGELVAECKGITAKITQSRTDVQLGFDIGNKLVGQKGEGTLSCWHVYSEKWSTVKQRIAGKDPRFQIVADVADPDAVGGKVERWVFNDCAFTDLTLLDAKTGEVMQVEKPFIFPPSKIKNQGEVA